MPEGYYMLDQATKNFLKTCPLIFIVGTEVQKEGIHLKAIVSMAKCSM